MMTIINRKMKEVRKIMIQIMKLKKIEIKINLKLIGMKIIIILSAKLIEIK